MRSLPMFRHIQQIPIGRLITGGHDTKSPMGKMNSECIRYSETASSAEAHAFPANFAGQTTLVCDQNKFRRLFLGIKSSFGLDFDVCPQDRLFCREIGDEESDVEIRTADLGDPNHAIVAPHRE